MKRQSRNKNQSQRGMQLDKKEYRAQLHALQIELVKLQKHFIQCDDRILVLIEGRDTAGKDGVIKRIVEHLSPRETRVVALGKPSDLDRTGWYFQRYTAHLPKAREFVLFNRSWYNRAGVERVMKFCTEAEYEEFMETVLDFEHMLVRSGIKLLKYYLDISRDEQKRRLEDRRTNPLKQWKISPIDAKAVKLWDDYSSARNEMLSRTHNAITPWTIVHGDNKRRARLNLIRDLLLRLHYCDKDSNVLRSDPEIVFPYHEDYVRNGMIIP
ncbi:MULTISPECIES: polyphosphate kinase 2 [Stappiaceae]|uniref:polyphosphate kinase 2 n=1 Tax=Stappiaceae TaxID=2821832 RepID=UPI00094B5B5A|nr:MULTISPECIES: polyphosphate kinase 2 [Stappiaceae]MBO9463233.1 polyphosphate kinase 2 [Labrenzia sp. R5_0]UES53891.1 polyphosphate kinase 2 [Roseibium aggregatum]UFI06765.1 polyphosphate kinase 2 [Roseibium aggregatum]